MTRQVIEALQASSAAAECPSDQPTGRPMNKAQVRELVQTVPLKHGYPMVDAPVKDITYPATSAHRPRLNSPTRSSPTW
jgi:hypothetical protein